MDAESDNTCSWHQFECHVNANMGDNKIRVGGFSVSRDEQIYTACKDLIYPAKAPPLFILPLRIHIARGPLIGTTITAEECSNTLLPRLNELWRQAGIIFDLVEVMEHSWPRKDNLIDVSAVHGKILSLCRDPSSGKMTGKKLRRDIFLGQLIGDDHLSPCTFDIWFFDMIGMDSQGCCIDRTSRTVIMGRRSTKGYAGPTERPLQCLGKTCAHELGHALHLNHPSGQKFKDGVPCDYFTGRNNLMTGGVDAAGGGGEALCPWQILVARFAAHEFLVALSDH